MTKTKHKPNTEHKKSDGVKKLASAFGRPFFVSFESFLNLIYPQPCRLCEKSVESAQYGTVCAECWENSPIFDGTEIICEKCGNFLIFDGLKVKTFCRRCNEDFFDTARAVGLYDKALMKTVLRLKITPSIPEKLKKLFIQVFLNSPFENADLIIPVPLSKGRLKQRGFNQASLLAKILADATGLKTDEKSLIRTVHTPKHRAGMDKKSRLDTVENAFAIADAANIKDKKILLVDDVFTSGATVSNCAKILKENGAAKVYVLTIARAR